MDFKMNICELGKLLKVLETNYKLEMTAKIQLSGGWMTINGTAQISKVPIDGLILSANNSNNIINIKINNNDTSIIKIIGNKNSEFSISLNSSKYRELSCHSISKIKISENECKLKIDDNIIFKINCSLKEVEKILQNN